LTRRGKSGGGRSDGACAGQSEEVERAGLELDREVGRVGRGDVGLARTGSGCRGWPGVDRFVNSGGDSLGWGSRLDRDVWSGIA
jgi:hypothetical protein